MDQQSHPTKTNQGLPPGSAFADHTRRWESFAYVYPVVSRRSQGLSIGINLNPDTICNFDCVYCQVDKKINPTPTPVDLDRLRNELHAILDAATTGELWTHKRFAGIDPALKRINDVAFSGDGEPTTAKSFPQAVQIAVELKNAFGLHGIKIVLITNATQLNRPYVESALQILDRNQGQVWAKLDAGTDSYYKKIDRSAVPLKTILDNILACGKHRPIVIQSMFANLHGVPVPDDEFDAYTDRIAELIGAGCRIELVQLYTIARHPLEPYVSALTDETLSHMSGLLNDRVPSLAVQWFGATG